MRSASLAALCLLLAACSGNAGLNTTVGTQPSAPTTIARPAPTTSSTSPTSTAATAPIGVCADGCWPPPDLPPGANRIATQPLAAGTFVTSRFGIPMTFEVTEDGDWRIRGEDQDTLVLASWIYDALPVSWWGGFAIFVTGPELDGAIGGDFVAAIRDDSCTGVMQGPSDVVVAGWRGVMIETRLPDDPDPPYGGACTFFGRKGGAPPTGNDLDHTRIFELDVDGQRLIVQLLAPSRSDLDELAEKVDRLFATMTIGG